MSGSTETPGGLENGSCTPQQEMCLDRYTLSMILLLSNKEKLKSERAQHQEEMEQ